MHKENWWTENPATEQQYGKAGHIRIPPASLSDVRHGCRGASSNFQKAVSQSVMRICAILFQDIESRLWDRKSTRVRCTEGSAFFSKKNSSPMRSASLLLLFAYQYTAAWPSFRLRLPNGERVPCPSDVPGCDANTPFCKGVGHTTCAGCAFRSACSNCFASPIFFRSRTTKR